MFWSEIHSFHDKKINIDIVFQFNWTKWSLISNMDCKNLHYSLQHFLETTFNQTVIVYKYCTKRCLKKTLPLCFRLYTMSDPHQYSYFTLKKYQIFRIFISIYIHLYIKRIKI